MKYYLLLFVFVICSVSSYAQHTERYIEFTNNFVLVDTILVNTTYNNGLKKDSGMRLVYEYGDYIYEFRSGKYLQYDKKGNVVTDSKFDDFGNYLSYKYSDNAGNIIEDYQIEKIDINAKSLDEFLKNTWKHTTVFGYQKKYRYSYKLCKNYLKKEGKVKNLIKIGNWKFYNEVGELIKEKVYN